jgi:hypothetical protein
MHTTSYTVNDVHKMANGCTDIRVRIGNGNTKEQTEEEKERETIYC